MAHRAEGVHPAGAPVGLGIGGGTLQVVCGHPQMEAPPRGPRATAEGGTGEGSATMEGAQGVAEGAQDRETSRQKGPGSATPQLCEQGQALALSEPISSLRLRTRRPALAGTAGSRPGGQSRQAPRDEEMRVQRCSTGRSPRRLASPRCPRGSPDPQANSAHTCSLCLSVLSPPTHFAFLH